MKFSVDRESVADMISSLTSYSDDIDSAFDRFQEEIKKIAVRTNYRKLLLALQGMTGLYQEKICRDMKRELISRWEDEGESLHAFAEDVYMGEEAVEAVYQIESALAEIFTDEYADGLKELHFDGDSNAEKEDFDEAASCFEAFEKEVEQIRESSIAYFQDKIEDNELYRFLIPLVNAFGVGVSSFLTCAKAEMERLGENYGEKMAEMEAKIQDAKWESALVDFADDLFDLDDAFTPSLLSAAKNNAAGNSSSALDNKNKSKEHIRNIGRKMMADFAPGRTDCKPIEEITEYADADDLAKDLRAFGSKGCNRKMDLFQELEKLKNDRKEGEDNIKSKYSKLLYLECGKIKGELEAEQKSLKRKFARQMIAKITGINLQQECVNRANARYNQEKEKLRIRYNNEMARYRQSFENKFREFERKRTDSYTTGVISKCRDLYSDRLQLADRIELHISGTEDDLKAKLDVIIKKCGDPCPKLIKICQDWYLKTKPHVRGFHSRGLGHRITVNEKQKYWIDVNLDNNERSQVSADGILDMKTPVHEYLHYLSSGQNGTSGVRNMDLINKTADSLERDEMLLAMTGFNEGITEMFAQDYLEEEMLRRDDFENKNDILAKEKKIIKQKSYGPQVDVIRAICEVLGGSEKVRESYIKHDFSIIENGVNEVFKKKGKTFNWEYARMLMKNIQKKYEQKEITKYEKVAIDSCADMIIRLLEVV